MLCSWSSSSFSSEDGSESNSDRGSVILGDSEVASQEEAAAYEANMALEAERELEFQRRFTGEVDVGTWSVYLKLLLHFSFRFVSIIVFCFEFLSFWVWFRSQQMLVTLAEVRTWIQPADIFHRCTCLNCSVTLTTKAEECVCCKKIDRVDEIMSSR